MGAGEPISDADRALLEAWSKLASDYEHRTSEPIVHPDPMSFIEYLMDHRGIGASDLVPDVFATLERSMRRRPRSSGRSSGCQRSPLPPRGSITGAW